MRKLHIGILVLGVGLVSSNVGAVELGVNAGEHYTDTHVGLGTVTSGLFLNGNWLRSDHDGRTVGVGIGYNFDLGPFRLAPEGKLIYTHPEDGKDGFTNAIGGRAQFNLTKGIGIYGDYFWGPKVGNYHADRYESVSAGLSVSPFSLLNFQAGYQHVEIHNEGNRRSNVLADGPFLSAALRF